MRPRFLTLSGLAVPAFGLLLGSVVTVAPSPAAAQFFPPYFDDAPGYDYGPPRAYRRYRAPVQEFSADDVRPMLRSMGFNSINPARAMGNAYVTEATDADGVRLRVRIDRYSGEVLSMRPIGADRAERSPVPVPPAPVRTPPKKPPAPKTAALPPSAPLPPPAAGEDAGAGSPGIAAPQGAAAPEAPATSTEAKPEHKPIEAKPTEAKPTEAKPAEAKPAEAKPAPSKEAAVKPEAPQADAPKAETPKAETPVRVIPGIAVPTIEAPAPPVADAKKGTGAGTGTPAGSVSAGTASVLSRDATKKPAEKPKTSSN